MTHYVEQAILESLKLVHGERQASPDRWLKVCDLINELEKEYRGFELVPGSAQVEDEVEHSGCSVMTKK